MRDAPTLPSGSEVFQQVESLTFTSETSKNVKKKKRNSSKNLKRAPKQKKSKKRNIIKEPDNVKEDKYLA